MIGQSELINKLNTYTADTLPKVSLFIGQDGCGKKTLLDYIINKFNLPAISISENITQELLTEYQQDPVYKFYVIDLNIFTQKQQNKLLKFIEEPGKTNYIILIASNEGSILETILNRCTKFIFQNYTKDELKQIKLFNNELIYEVCTVPGQLINLEEKTFADVYALCETIVEKIDQATFANALSISQKINYKDEYDKYDFNLFLTTLKFVLYKKYIKENIEKYFEAYMFIIDFMKSQQIKSLNAENSMISFLICLKQLLNN